jgi:UDP-N-acetylmuramate: L-alanyl-gamma-D-glutamyl-meso-diaminopimelate ligase
MLDECGIEVSTPFDAERLDAGVDLVVVGNAISRGNPELEKALDCGLPICSMPELIERLLVPGRRVSVVAGTHGKTTTASMLVHLHLRAGGDPSFVIGGRPGEMDSGARLGGGRDLVLEGDEYDSAFFDKGPKFLHYWPNIAVLGAVEFDHADIYADLAAVERTFGLFVRMIPRGGTLIVDGTCPVATRLAEKARSEVLRIGLDPRFDFGLSDRRDGPDGQRFVVTRSGGPIGEASLVIPGAHNAKNALAAIAAAEAAGLDSAAAAASLASFLPPDRRLQKIASRDGFEVYDDFAHHVSAIRATLQTMRDVVPAGGRLIACFEPRSNTMVRRIVQRDLEHALALADVVLLAPVDRPERFGPDERLDVPGLVDSLRARGLEAEGPLEPGEIAQRVQALARSGDRVVLMSNGAFGGLASLLAGAENR